ncbi:unnamed protein product [Lactuca virosa]|uniref:Uncharacterized protein n=1 Tax=Lactuca virosa TaxID=75947 RepID=A0AAU9PL13_9ASTR|nr:unnamed protein product [Lactuca virosa]
MMVARGCCLFNKCYRGNFEGDLQYHEVPQVETLSVPTKVGPVFKGDIPHVEAGVRAVSPVRGSGVVSGQVVSRRRSAAADCALEEDVSDNTIGRRLHRKCNIDPLFAKSPIVIEIVDGDDPQAMETVGLRRLGEPGIMGTRSVLTSVSGNAPSATDPSSSVAPGVYLPSEFTLGICRVKAAYVAVGIERGKQMAQVWSAGSGPGSCDPDATERSVDIMHAAIRDFAKTGFVSYIHLGELSLANLRQLCSEEEELVSDGGADGAASTQPRQG